MPQIYTLTRFDVLASNCYILDFDDFFCVVDPSVSFKDAKNKCNLYGKPKYVFLTHGHIDHFWEIESYVRAGAQVLISSVDGKILKDPNKNCSKWLTGSDISYCGEYKELYDGDIISVGDGQLKVISTPGHTAGSLCFLGEGFMFSGDTLFAEGSYGRTDLPSGNAMEMSRSLNKLLSLDGNIRIYSGHGEETTIKDTKAFFN